MPVVPTIDTSLLREAAKRVKLIEPSIRKDLIANIKKDLNPYAQQIAGDVPDLGRPGAMRGFGHGGRTRWSKVRGATYVTPGGGRGSVARIELFGTSDAQAAIKIADLAGTRGNYNNGNYSKGGFYSYLINGQGEDLVSRLTDFARLSANGRGGRFGWAGFLRHRRTFISAVEKRLDEYAKRASEKVVG